MVKANQRVLERLKELAKQEARAYEESLSLLASAGHIPAIVSQAHAIEFERLTNEGFVGSRYHPRNTAPDVIEELAIKQAQQAFGCNYANVQSHSASTANLSIIMEILEPGDRILSLKLSHGGHLSHGTPASSSSKFFNVSHYQLTDGVLDMGRIREIALENAPQLIIAGASSYPLSIDFAEFSAIAKETGAMLLADISHIAGLVVTGLHQDPCEYADFVTTSLYKQLLGPRGGLILGKGLSDGMSSRLNRSVFPASQGTPDFSNIAAKAAALSLVQTEWYGLVITRAKEAASKFASSLVDSGIKLVSGGTETTTLLLDLTDHSCTGKAVEKTLEGLGVAANRNLIPGDKSPPSQTSGLRIGTLGLSLRGFDDAAIAELASLVSKVVLNRARLGILERDSLAKRVKELARTFPYLLPPRSI